ncbi:MAG TPA: plastocyanin/azurin family copper-binding protein [Gemmatimonadaceae bacterium]|jgi:plastocyanin
MQILHHALGVAASCRRALATASLGTTLCLVACGGGGGGSTAPTTTTTPVIPTGPTNVTVENNAFTPSTLTVPVGSKVTWTWNSCSDNTYGTGTCVTHSIVWDADGSGSGLLSQGTYDRTFAAAGTYAYHCGVHGAAMAGTITVQ